MEWNSASIPHIGGVEVSLYAVLGIPRGATSSEIRRAYRRICLKVHPDKEADPAAQGMFELVRHAHTVLMDPVARKKYDARNEWMEAHPEVIVHDVRATPSGPARRRPSANGRRPRPDSAASHASSHMADPYRATWPEWGSMPLRASTAQRALDSAGLMRGLESAGMMRGLDTAGRARGLESAGVSRPWSGGSDMYQVPDSLDAPLSRVASPATGELSWPRPASTVPGGSQRTFASRGGHPLAHTAGPGAWAAGTSGLKSDDLGRATVSEWPLKQQAQSLTALLSQVAGKDRQPHISAPLGFFKETEPATAGTRQRAVKTAPRSGGGFRGCMRGTPARACSPRVAPGSPRASSPRTALGPMRERLASGPARPRAAPPGTVRRGPAHAWGNRSASGPLR